MNTQDPITPTDQPQRRILIALLACMAMVGILFVWFDAIGIDEPEPVRIGSMFLFSAQTFGWYWYDSEYRSYKRTPLLNIAVTAIAILAIPYYLIRSRPAGKRMAAMGKLVGFMLLMFVAMVLGAVLFMFSIGTIICPSRIDISRQIMRSGAP